jgi:hypothetical protein
MRALLGWSDARLEEEVAATEAVLARHGAAVAA